MLALIIAPILAVISYFAIDHMVSEKPHKAKAGASYRLIAKPNCRYPSGKCTFKNGNFEVELVLDPKGANQLLLSLKSNFSLQGAKVSLSDIGDASLSPEDMLMMDADGKYWQQNYSQALSESSEIRMVLAAADAIYFGDTQVGFVEYGTSYQKDFRRE